jgi:hypothetical protein
MSSTPHDAFSVPNPSVYAVSELKVYFPMVIETTGTEYPSKALPLWTLGCFSHVAMLTSVLDIDPTTECLHE